MSDPVGARLPRWIGTIAAAAMAASAIGFNPLAAGASATVIDEFPIPTRASTPQGITAGSDGNLWFAESTGGSRIGQITPTGSMTGSITEFSGLTGASFWITSGPGGNLWTTEPGANAIGELSSAGAFVGEFTVPTLGSNPDQIALGPDGNLWFTENVGNQIGKITPDGKIKEYPIPTESSGPSAIVAGPDGNLWFTEQSKNKIGQITTGGAITEFAPVGSGPGGMAAGPDGNVWFTEFYGNQIGRITPAGDIDEFALNPGGSAPASIAAGPDGNLWFTEYGSNQIGWMSPTGVMLGVFSIPTGGSQPNGITTGPDGNLWFTESAANQIGRLTPGTAADSTALTYDGATTGDFNDPATVSATLVDTSTTPSTPLIGQSVVFTLNGAETCTGLTDASGHASCQLTPAETSGSYSVAASFAGTATLNASSTSASFVVTDSTALTYDGATTADFNDPATVSATLADTSTTPSTPLSGQSVVFTLNGAETCTGVTDASGHASCQLTPAETSGAYSVAASFAGTATLKASSTSASFVVTVEEAALTLTAPAAIANGSPVTLNAVLATDGTPLAGRTVTLVLGTGAAAQTCTAITSGTGAATCTIAAVNQPLGPGGLTASFAGDGFFTTASAGGSSLVFAFLSGGIFVIGDGSPPVGGSVTFWSSTWSTANILSGGSGAASFKGFAITMTQASTCGGTWTSTGGTSSNPPAGPLPAYMAVAVTSSAEKSGSTITGHFTGIVIVKTDPGYAPAAGGTGTGTVVAVLCSA